MRIRHFGALFVMIAMTATSSGQVRDSLLVQQVDSLKQQVVLLRQQLQALRLETGAPSPAEEDIELLEERIDSRLRELENKIGAVSRARATTAFNPPITAFINAAARIDDQDVTDASGKARIDDRPFLRSLELDLRAPVDPYAEAVAIISLEDEAGTGFAVDPEEAYGVLKRLPILESAPLGMKVKVGKYRAAFGTNNRLHLHDMPWITRPLVVSKYLGTEHGDFFESGFSPVGVDFDFYLPSPVPASTLEMNLDVVRAGELGLAEGGGATQPAYFGHLNWFKDWESEHFLTLGLSGYYEGTLPRTRLAGLDLTYKWRPSVGGEFRSFIAGGEVFFGDHRFQSGVDLDGDGVPDVFPVVEQKPLGWFAYAQYQLSWWLHAGIRYDSVKEPEATEVNQRSWSGFLSYYTTEFLRFRIGYEHRTNNLVGNKALNSVQFEINFVFGSHPVEPYWVNR